MLAACSAALMAASLLVAALGEPRRDAAPALADLLSPSTWAMAVPAGWIASSPVGIRAGDRVDVIAMRSGERGYALPIAFDLRVLSTDAAALVLEVGEDDALALATAKSGGLLIVPILRSSR